MTDAEHEVGVQFLDDSHERAVRRAMHDVTNDLIMRNKSNRENKTASKPDVTCDKTNKNNNIREVV
ncbi:MAG: hypothetical protein ACRC2T_17130 [Thermoguttaceae bacterium]